MQEKQFNANNMVSTTEERTASLYQKYKLYLLFLDLSVGS